MTKRNELILSTLIVLALAFVLAVGFEVYHNRMCDVTEIDNLQKGQAMFCDSTGCQKTTLEKVCAKHGHEEDYDFLCNNTGE